MAYWIILIAANIPVYIGIGWVLFGSWSSFSQEIEDDHAERSWGIFDPDREDRDPLASLKVGGFLALCAAAVYLEHVGISKIWH
jgi:hypothetical protein